MRLVRFLESSVGRWVRGLAGLAMIGVGVGLSVEFGGAWWVLAAVGLVPALAGLFGFCLLAPVVHRPFVHRARTV